MPTPKALHQFLDHAAGTHPDHVAVEEPNKGKISYRNLAALSDRLRDRLYYLGVRPGDRVGIYLSKSIDAVAAIFGILKAGAAYVPVDPTAPVSRNAYILNNCSVRVAIMESRFEASFRAEIDLIGVMPSLLLLEGTGGGSPLQAALRREAESADTPGTEAKVGSLDDLAYILYTSGSTGRPKGVMLTQRNAMRFVDWCSEVVEPHDRDRFSSHAPLHFDSNGFDSSRQVAADITHATFRIPVRVRLSRRNIAQQLTALGSQ